MPKRSLKSVLGVGAAAALLFGGWRWFAARRRASDITWEPQPFPLPPRPVTKQGPGDPGD